MLRSFLVWRFGFLLLWETLRSCEAKRKWNRIELLNCRWLLEASCVFILVFLFHFVHCFINFLQIQFFKEIIFNVNKDVDKLSILGLLLLHSSHFIHKMSITSSFSCTRLLHIKISLNFLGGNTDHRYFFYNTTWISLTQIWLRRWCDVSFVFFIVSTIFFFLIVQWNTVRRKQWRVWTGDALVQNCQ